MKDKLTATESNILSRIVDFGGYITKDILNMSKPNITIDGCYRILRSLLIKGYLLERSYYNNNKAYNKAKIYQVTEKGLAACDRSGAYMRHKHKPPAVHRYLIRTHFLFSFSERYPVYHCSVREREEYLLSVGYCKENLPQKYNRSKSGEIFALSQIEEYLLLEGPFSKEGELCIVVIDKQNSGIAAQIVSILKRYKRMINERKYVLKFLFVTEFEYRARAYMDVYNSRFYDEKFYTITAVSINKKYCP